MWTQHYNKYHSYLEASHSRIREVSHSEESKVYNDAKIRGNKNVEGFATMTIYADNSASMAGLFYWHCVTINRDRLILRF